MSISSVLPNELLITVINNMDPHIVHNHIAAIPELKSLISVNVDLSLIQSFINNKIDVYSYFDNYQFIHIIINDNLFVNDQNVSNKLFQIIKVLISNKEQKYNVKIDYLLNEIDLNFLKNFKSFFYKIENSKKYSLSFPNLVKLKINSNHLLINDLTLYKNLESLNLYYCSSNFLLQVFQYLNPSNHGTFPSLKNLKIQDYMNESEDVYLKTSDNYDTKGDDDDDDFDHNSDFDENEFYFDGLEILQNFNTFKLENLTIKNCNLSKLQNMNFNSLINLKIIAVNDKHTDAYDVINSDEFILNNGIISISKQISTSSFKSGPNLIVMNNNFPHLKNFILIGNLNLKKFANNTFNSNLQTVFIKSVDSEVTNNEEFHKAFESTNRFV